MEPYINPARLADQAGIGTGRAAALLDYATAFVNAYLGREYTFESVPEPVRVVTLQVATRAAQARPGVSAESQTAGPFAQQTTFGSGDGFYLTRSDKRILAPYRVAPAGIGTVSTVRDDGDGVDVPWFMRGAVAP